MKIFNDNRDEKGFTLIEVLIVVAIVGILACIAIPTFATYKTKALDSTAKADLRNAAAAQEAYYIDNDTYSPSLANLEESPYNFLLSAEVNITVTTADTSGYQMSAVHSGSGKVFTLTGPGGDISD